MSDIILLFFHKNAEKKQRKGRILFLVRFFDFFSLLCYNNSVMNVQDKNIVLIGMPCSGKSTVGPLIAKTIGYGFIDSDIAIQTSENALLAKIIAKEGQDGFLQIENRVNVSLSEENRCVISTGGSVVYCDEAMERLKESGVVVYLKVSFSEIARRLGNILLSRGVIIRKGESLFDLYAERTPLYEKYADFTVDCEGQTVEETVHTVCRLVKERIG